MREPRRIDEAQREGLVERERQRRVMKQFLAKGDALLAQEELVAGDLVRDWNAVTYQETRRC